jgi:hypothetical protein
MEIGVILSTCQLVTGKFWEKKAVLRAGRLPAPVGLTTSSTEGRFFFGGTYV